MRVLMRVCTGGTSKVLLSKKQTPLSSGVRVTSDHRYFGGADATPRDLRRDRPEVENQCVPDSMRWRRVCRSATVSSSARCPSSGCDAAIQLLVRKLDHRLRFGSALLDFS